MGKQSDRSGGENETAEKNCFYTDHEGNKEYIRGGDAEKWSKNISKQNWKWNAKQK